MRSLKRSEEWAIALSRFSLSRLFFWRKSIVAKILLINGLVVAVVIWQVGVSVKDFACTLVDRYGLIGAERQAFFNSTMHYYLLRASLIAVAVAALIYFVLMARVLRPLRQLMRSARMMAEGEYPAPVAVNAEDEIARLARYFNRMVQTLKEAEESRRRLLSDISHELRTPLSNLNGYLEALSSGVIQGDIALYRSLHEEAQQLSHLVEQLRQLARWQSGQWHGPALQPVEVGSVIRAVLKSFELELARRNIRCETDLAAGAVLADETGLRQVAANLLQNAIRYDRGGWIRISGEASGAVYRVAVANAGNPIPAEKAEQLFERFYRVDPSRHRDTGGLGLGLAIAKEIVGRHGGKIGLHTDGRTHTFWFEWPRLLKKS